MKKKNKPLKSNKKPSIKKRKGMRRPTSYPNIVYSSVPIPGWYKLHFNAEGNIKKMELLTELNMSEIK